MPFRGFDDEVGLVRRQLARMRDALAATIERFGRDARRYRDSPVARRPRYWQPTRLPYPRVGRPVMRRVALPRRLRARTPITVLERRRMIEAHLRGGRPAIVEAVEGGAQRLADVVRRGLLGLRGRLRVLQQRGRVASRVANRVTRVPSRRR